MKLVIIFQFHAFGYEAAFSRPQVFPKANLIYPDSPHEVFHEFLTTQASAVYPTNKTPWSKLVPQSDKTPPE